MDQTAAGAATFLSSIGERKPFDKDYVFGDLDEPATANIIDIGAFRARQLANVLAASPFLLVSNIAIAVCFTAIGWRTLNQSELTTWASALMIPSLLLLASWVRNRKRNLTSVPHAAIRRAEFWAVILAIGWAAFPALFFTGEADGLQTLVIALTIAASAIGTMSLSRVPSAAIIYNSLISGSLAYTSLKIGGAAGGMFGGLAVLYGVLMAGIVLNTHARALQRAVDNIDISKKSEIIALLLNDFEAGARDWLWETGPDHGLAYGAERFAELLGDRSRDLRGRTLGDVAGAPEDNAGWIALAEAMAGHKQIESLELEIPGEDGGRWWQFAARPLFGRDGSFRGYRGVGRDVTAQRQTQEKLIQAKEAAEAANAAKTQFLAVMSHELKTPLNAIVGFSELLANAQNGSLGPETSRDYATTVLSGARHLQAVINDILDATRIERGTMTLVEQEADAAELAEVALKMCREQAEQADVVMLAKLIDGIAIHGDMTRLKQVFLNILTNAIKFSPAGSYVNISFQKTDVGGLSLTVRDSGIGIKAEDLERVFEPFVQADEGSARHFGGIGLGLSIARKIARLHGGDVTLDSEPGAGTTAQLILPPARVTWPTPRSNTKSVAA